MARLSRARVVGTVALALFAWACKNEVAPTISSDANYQSTVVLADGATVPFNMSLFLRKIASGVNEVSGGFTAGPVTGSVQGTLTGTLESGTFNGKLLAESAPGAAAAQAAGFLRAGGAVAQSDQVAAVSLDDSCVVEQVYTGSVTAGGLSWTPGPVISNCARNPLNFTVQAPKTTQAATTSTSTTSSVATTSVPTTTTVPTTIPATTTVISTTTTTSTSTTTTTIPDAPTGCGTISASSPLNVPASGGPQTVAVTTQFSGPSCTLGVSSVTPSSPWLTNPVIPQNTLTFTVAANTTASARSATIRVANTQNANQFFNLVVNQAAAAGCGVISANPNPVSVPSGGGSQTVAITTEFSGASCTLGISAVPPPPFWVTNAAIQPNVLTFTVAANATTSPRSATIRVENTQNTSQFVNVVINQAAAPAVCSITLTPSVTSFSPAGQSGTITVAATNCTSLSRGGINSDFTFGGSLNASGGTITVSTARRVSAVASSVTVTVTDSPSNVSQGVTLTQRRAAEECNFTNPPVVSGRRLQDAASTFDVTVTISTADCLWSARVQDQFSPQGAPFGIWVNFVDYVNNAARYSFSGVTPGSARWQDLLIFNSLIPDNDVPIRVCQNAGTSTYNTSCDQPGGQFPGQFP